VPPTPAPHPLVRSAGAAIWGSLLSDDPNYQSVDPLYKSLVLHDLTPLSLGTDVVGNRVLVIIPRNSPLPVTHTKTFSTAHDSQPSMSVKVHAFVVPQRASSPVW
jgi:molecular chaperone DnaK (HSP70)